MCFSGSPPRLLLVRCCVRKPSLVVVVVCIIAGSLWSRGVSGNLRSRLPTVQRAVVQGSCRDDPSPRYGGVLPTMVCVRSNVGAQLAQGIVIVVVVIVMLFLFENIGGGGGLCSRNEEAFAFNHCRCFRNVRIA